MGSIWSKPLLSQFLFTCLYHSWIYECGRGHRRQTQSYAGAASASVRDDETQQIKHKWNQQKGSLSVMQLLLH